jgi:hypothetical protein
MALLRGVEDLAPGTQFCATEDAWAQSARASALGTVWRDDLSPDEFLVLYAPGAVG